MKKNYNMTFTLKIFTYICICLGIYYTHISNTNAKSEVNLFHVFLAKMPNKDNPGNTNVAINGKKLNEFDGYWYGANTSSTLKRKGNYKFITNNPQCDTTYETDLKIDNDCVLVYYVDKVYNESGQYLGYGVKIKKIEADTQRSSYPKLIAFSFLENETFDIKIGTQLIKLTRFVPKKIRLNSYDETKVEELARSADGKTEVIEGSEYNLSFETSRKGLHMKLENDKNYFMYLFKKRDSIKARSFEIILSSREEDKDLDEDGEDEL